MSKGFSSNWRTVFIACGVFACFGTVVGRLVYLQILNRHELLKFVERARRQVIVDQARRGDILDRHGNILATSRPLLTVGADPAVLRKEDETKWPELARLLGVPFKDLTAQLNKKLTAEDASDDNGPAPRPIHWVKLSENIDESANDAIVKLNIKGVYSVRRYQRSYPGNTLAAHVLGYLGKEGEPATGLERYMNFYLRGMDGWRESEKDGLRRELAQFRTREVEAADGYTVVLTLDAVIQHMAEQELQAVADKFHPQKATIIVSDPATGALLAMANYPTFNLNEYGKADAVSQRSFAVADFIEPGSTFKIVASSGALNDGLVTPDSKFDCGITTIDYKGKTLKLPSEAPGDHFAELTVTDIIGHSSNRGAAQLGMLLGEQRLYSYAHDFGFGQRPGFPVGGETPGQLARPEKWDSLTITRMPMGHAVSASPLQIHYAMGTIANGGVLMRPQIIKEIRNADGVLVSSIEPVSVRRVVRPEVAQSVAYMLTKVITEGTGSRAEIPNYELAGKTGTAMKIVDGKYSEKNHVCSFVGFFPASHPRVMLSIIVDDGHLPNGAPGMAAIVAAPSFKHMGEQLIQYMDIKPVVTTSQNMVAMGRGNR